MPVAIKLDRVGINNEELLSINSHNPLITWSREATWYIKNISTMPMATEPGRVVTFNQERSSINSEDLSITWSCKVT